MADQYDFFVSYSRADNSNGWISAFIKELKAEYRRFSGGREFKEYFDEKEIKSVDDWQHNIFSNLQESRLLVAFISPHYFASEWCRREWRAWVDVEIAKHVLRDGASAVYIVPVPWLDQEKISHREVAEEIARLTCRNVEDIPQSLTSESLELRTQLARREFTKVQRFFNDGLAAFTGHELRNALEKLTRELADRAEYVSAAEKSYNGLPRYNRRFVGRLEELSFLRNILNEKKRPGIISSHKGNLGASNTGVACVHGLGGIGKTELAITYAHAFAGLYPGGRFLVPSEGFVDIRMAMTRALDSKFPDCASDEQRKDLDLFFGAILGGLRDRIKSLGKILLILDNVSERAMIRVDHLDKLLIPDLHLLATTRLGAPESSGGDFDEAHWLTLGELTFEDSVRLLEKHRPFSNEAERVAAGQIAHRLGGFALCVEVVGAYLGQHSKVMYADYLQRMGLSDLEHVDLTAERGDVETRRHNHEKRLKAILEPTLASLSAASRTAMTYAAFLPPDQFVISWLRTLVASQFSELGNTNEKVSNDLWAVEIGQLEALALVTRDGQGDTPRRVMRVHRLVQEVVKSMLSAEDWERTQGDIHAVVYMRDESLGLSPLQNEQRWELDAFEALAWQWEESGFDQATWLMNQTAYRWMDMAEWSRAEHLLERALALDLKIHGPTHPNVAVRYSNLGTVIWKNGRLQDAERHLRSALAINLQLLTAGDPKLATDRGKLAQVLRAQGKLDEATELLQQSLKAEVDPNRAIRLSDLSRIHFMRNQFAEAESLLREAISLNAKTSSEFDRNMAVDLQSLACIVEEQGRWAEAEELNRKVVSIHRVSSPMHPELASSLNNHSLLLLQLGRYSEAEPLAREALAIVEKHYEGGDHPDVASKLNTLAWVLMHIDRIQEAEPMMFRAYEMYSNVFGYEHPDTVQVGRNLRRLLSRKKGYIK